MTKEEFSEACRRLRGRGVIVVKDVETAILGSDELFSTVADLADRMREIYDVKALLGEGAMFDEFMSGRSGPARAVFEKMMQTLPRTPDGPSAFTCVAAAVMEYAKRGRDSAA